MTSSEAVLWQFRRSPFNEKARWALDLAGVRYERRSLLPGMHVLPLLVRTGNTLTPALQREGRFTVGSSAIVRRLVEQGASSLYPSAPAQRAEALALERRFDEDLTPRVRRAVLAALLEAPAAWHETFTADAEPGAAARYRAALSLLAPVIRLKNGIRARTIEDGRAALEEALALVSATLAGRAYLVGEALSVADVTAASALAMVTPVEHPSACYGPLAREALAALFAVSEARPEVTAWTRGLFARERDA